MKLLLIDSCKNAGLFLSRAFREEGHIVDSVQDASEAVRQLLLIVYDLVVIGPTLSRGTALEVCRQARRAGRTTMMLMIMQDAEHAGVMEAFRAGVDDCLPSPFDVRELMARVHALLRRAGRARETELSVGPFVVNTSDEAAFVSGKRLELTHTEVKLMCVLLRSAGRPVSREEIIKSIWEVRQPSELVTTHVRNLRRKLGRYAEYVETVRGVGYRLRKESDLQRG